MVQKSGLWLMCLALAVALSACSADSDTLGEQEALDLAWQALDPNSSSHDPQKSAPSATAPPAVPEPFLRQAFLLIDVARKLHCIVH